MWQEGKAYVRQKYRRRPLRKVMEEIEDEVKEHFSENEVHMWPTIESGNDALFDLMNPFAETGNTDVDAVADERSAPQLIIRQASNSPRPELPRFT